VGLFIFLAGLGAMTGGLVLHIAGTG